MQSSLYPGYPKALYWLLGIVEATIEDLDIPTVHLGNLTKEDGDAVLSTTLPKDLRCGLALEQS